MRQTLALFSMAGFLWAGHAVALGQYAYGLEANVGTIAVATGAEIKNGHTKAASLLFGARYSRLFFRLGLGAQQRWIESTDFDLGVKENWKLMNPFAVTELEIQVFYGLLLGIDCRFHYGRGLSLNTSDKDKLGSEFDFGPMLAYRVGLGSRMDLTLGVIHSESSQASTEQVSQTMAILRLNYIRGAHR